MVGSRSAVLELMAFHLHMGKRLLDPAPEGACRGDSLLVADQHRLRRPAVRPGLEQVPDRELRESGAAPFGEDFTQDVPGAVPLDQ